MKRFSAGGLWIVWKDGAGQGWTSRLLKVWKLLHQWQHESYGWTKACSCGVWSRWMSVVAHTVILTQILLVVFFRLQTLSHVCPFDSASMMRVLKQDRTDKKGLGHWNATQTAVAPLIWDQNAALYLLNMLIACWFSVWWCDGSGKKHTADRQR